MMAALLLFINIASRISPLLSLVPIYDAIISADYENGNVTSGISGLTGTRTPAVDAAYVADFGRNSNKSICHKAVLNDSAYFSSSASRSESDTLDIEDTRYISGTEFIYKFNLYLEDWGDWTSGAIPIDIIWQFKHTDGGPDAMLGIKRNSLVLRYGENSAQANIVADVRPFDNQWIDIKAHIKWEDTSTGFIRIMAQPPNDNEPVEVFNVDNFKTFTDNGSGDFGYLKWGLYRPDSTVDNNYNERVACHDNVEIIKVLYAETSEPSIVPTTIPTSDPTNVPTNTPTIEPTIEPTYNPFGIEETISPSLNPRIEPTTSTKTSTSTLIFESSELQTTMDDSSVDRPTFFFSMIFVFIIVCFQ